MFAIWVGNQSNDRSLGNRHSLLRSRRRDLQPATALARSSRRMMGLMAGCLLIWEIWNTTHLILKINIIESLWYIYIYMIDFEHEFWWLKTVEDFPKSWRWWSTSGFSLFFWDLSLLFGMITKRISGKSPVHVARRILRHVKNDGSWLRERPGHGALRGADKLVIYKWEGFSVYNIYRVYIYICSYLNCLWVVSMLFLFILAIYIYRYYIVLIICDHDQYISLGEVQWRHVDVTLTSLEW